MLSHRCAHAQVLLRHNHHLVTMRKRSWFLYKVLVLSPPTGWNMSCKKYPVTSNKYWNSATDSVLRLLDLCMWQRATETDKSEHKRVFQKHINANFFILAPNVFFKGTFVSRNKSVVVKTNSTKSFLLRFVCFHVLMMNL